MAIKIEKEPDIVFTVAEFEHLHGQYLSETRNWYGVNPPPSFETWVRRRKADELAGKEAL